jgi:hydroxymethylpyrimidine/phosphomethylpyrimidine kinase
LRPRTPIALAIAGSDSGAGAGIQADLKTFAAFGIYGASAITAITAQNTLGVTAIHLVPPHVVARQIETVLADFNVAAIKIGMLGSAGVVAAVADALLACMKRAGAPFIVYDPVMAASSGDALSGDGFVEAIKVRLLPLVDCLTPNLAEGAALLDDNPAGDEQDMARQGGALLALGPRAILMKGGHLTGAEAVDLLATSGGVQRFAAPRLASRNLHGTGCTLASAMAAEIALGRDLEGAVGAAREFVRQAIKRGANLMLGAGPGPLIQIALGNLGDREFEAGAGNP